MHSQLPEHEVASLLRQCFVTPRCQASRQRQGALCTSSIRTYHRVRPAPGDEALRFERQRRCYHTQKRVSNENGVFRQANFSGLGLAQRRDVKSPLVPLLQKRQYAQGSKSQGTKNIAVLGGGITGLTSAHYLAREFPNSKVTVYEGGDRIGGWLQSKYVDVGNGKILFEQGPRTLRPSTPSAQVTIEMVCQIRRYSNGSDLS